MKKVFSETEQLFRLPKNAITIMRYIDSQGPKTQKELKFDLDLSLRALRYALRRMELRGVINKRANLSDMRSLFYTINPTIGNIETFFQEEGLVAI